MYRRTRGVSRRGPTRSFQFSLVDSELIEAVIMASLRAWAGLAALLAMTGAPSCVAFVSAFPSPATTQRSCSSNYVRPLSMAAGEIPKLDATPPMKVALIVEPTPFTHISGYANRFKEMLKCVPFPRLLDEWRETKRGMTFIPPR